MLTSRKYLSVAAAPRYVSRFRIGGAEESVLTDEVKLEEGKTIRRLELKELLEVLEGPVEEETSKLPRVRGRTVYDRLEGWVTVTGNNGHLAGCFMAGLSLRHGVPGALGGSLRST